MAPSRSTTALAPALAEVAFSVRTTVTTQKSSPRARSSAISFSVSSTGPAMARLRQSRASALSSAPRLANECAAAKRSI